VEIELKFEVDAAGATQLSQNLALASEGDVQSLRSVYFDTPDAELHAEGMALRVRGDGRRFVQTVKTSGNGSGFRRGEWESEVEGPGPDLAAISETPLGAVLDRCEAGTLRAAFETRVERTRRDISVDDAVVEVALDRGVLDAAGRDAPILELELELKAGRPEALFTLARKLADVAQLTLSFASKAERGYALLDGEPMAPARAHDPVLSRDDDTAAAFKAIAGAALAQMADNARVLRHARRIEALHQLRIGARRLRSALSLFRPMLADDRFEGVKTELKWLTHELDDARNLDVFIKDTFRPAARRHDGWTGLAALGRALITAQTRAYERVDRAIGGERFRALMLETAAWIETGPWTTADDPALAALRARPIARTAAEILQDRRRRVAKEGRKLARLEPAARHKLRINAKKLRYACGFFASLYSGKAAKRLGRFLKGMEGLQDGLGALTDIAAAAGLTAKLAHAEAGEGERAADLVFAAGLVAGERQADAAKAIKTARKAVSRFAAAERFW
jgi:triphosphatase